jgi:hypothetical protein
MNYPGLKRAQGQLALTGNKIHKSTARSVDFSDAPMIERPQRAKRSAVGFNQVGVRIGWNSKLIGWDDAGLLQVTEETVDDGLHLESRRESGSEFR